MISGDGLPVEVAIRYGVQIADALAHAHERGVVHRDLKSANVIVTPEGRPKVLDFGLARRVIEAAGEATRSQSLTEAGTVSGTLSLWRRKFSRSDLWALGVMLYQAVTGSLPFQGRRGSRSARRSCGIRRRHCRRMCRRVWPGSSSACWPSRRGIPTGQ
ncbi:MAG: protein kinase [Acidobacteria bacterium]|nr:protein kinase [Acidobacteriota bacterium]